ncbi:hypothetical protein [Devriesea agamarum]|uniref:hypothetical protein n=1 Tax=Devriesea agamarum TaxID=472569 RepID=UPI0012EEA226|nr:hypothetical protein [Devriesea agamarum]
MSARVVMPGSVPAAKSFEGHTSFKISPSANDHRKKARPEDANDVKLHRMRIA